MALLLDTHIWIWLTEGDKRLSRANAAHIEKAGDGTLMISAISVWEIAMLAHRGRLLMDRSPRAWAEASFSYLGIHVIPLAADTALESYALPGNFHSDPADRLIVATARQKGLTLVTQDKAILAYAKKGHVTVLK